MVGELRTETGQSLSWARGGRKGNVLWCGFPDRWGKNSAEMPLSGL